MAFDWSGNSYETYDVKAEGLGSPAKWRSAFNVRMGFEEAQRIRRNSRFSSEYLVLTTFAGVHVDEKSMWSEIKAAFRKASKNTHPDRVVQRGDDPKVAEENFKEVNAAYTMLEDLYRTQNRLG